MKDTIPIKYKNSSGIYCIENIANGKKYIGSTMAFRKRYTKHYFELSKGIHQSKHMQLAYNKYGSDSFQFSIIEVIDKNTDEFNKVLLDIENQYILKFKTNEKQNGYNLRLSAESNYGITHSEFAKTRIKGKKLPDSTKEKMSLSRQGIKHHSVKLTTEIVKEIKILIGKGYRNTHISKYLGLHKSYINDIKNNGSWISVKINKHDIDLYDSTRIDKIDSCRLTDYGVMIIKYLILKNIPNYLISKYCETPSKKISEIKIGKIYKHIELNETQINKIEDSIDWTIFSEIANNIDTQKTIQRKQTSLKGESNSSSKLKEKDVVIIKNMILEGFTDKEIAELFEVSFHSISKIRSGDNWGHLTKFEKKKIGRKYGNKHHNFKHSDEKVLMIIQLHKNGLSTKEICEKLDLEKSFVNRVKSGKTRNNITKIIN